MVREEVLSGNAVFGCEECGLLYAHRETAEKCQSWCETHPSRSLEIARQSVGASPAGGKAVSG
jgi:hypothetical protein